MKETGEALTAKVWAGPRRRSSFKFMVIRYAEDIPSLDQQWIVWKFCNSLVEALTFIHDEVAGGRKLSDYEVWTKIEERNNP